MSTSPSEDQATTAKMFAKALHSRWRVGHGSCGDGVLLLLALQNRQVGHELSCMPAAVTRINSDMRQAKLWKNAGARRLARCGIVTLFPPSGSLTHVRSDLQSLA